MNRIYCAVGKIMEVTQFIELRLIEICEYSEIIKEFGRHTTMTSKDYKQAKSDAKYLRDKMETMTFGARINIVKESESLSYDETSQLRSLLEKRNYFTHEYFKFTDFREKSEEFILEEFDAIKQYLKKLNVMLERLELIKKGQTDRLDFLKTKIKN